MSGVLNNTPVDAPTTNGALLAKNGDDTTVGRVGVASTETNAGATIAAAGGGIQRVLNALASYSGMALSAVYNILPTWTSTAAGTPTDNLTQRAEALTVKLNDATGHDHSGSGGNGKPISAVSIANVSLRGIFTRGTDLTGVSGLTTNVSTQMAGKDVSTSSATVGVVTNGSYNKVRLRKGSDGDLIEDGSGNEVYARITNSGGPSGTWTLTYYVDIAGVETAYSIPSPIGVRFWYQFLQNPITGVIVYSEDAFIPSDNATQDILDATPTQAGKVNTGTQSFAGTKTFTGAVNIDGATRLATSLTGVLKAAAGVVSASLLDLASEVTGILGVARGGTGASLAATGGTSQYLKQVSAGAVVTVGTIPAVDYPTFIGSDGISAGVKGAVPQPAIADNVKFLRGDGVFALPSTGGGGKGVVSIGPTGSGADYETTGANDNLVFNSAIADTKLNLGGTLLILAGTYNFSANHAYASGVHYRGVHRDLVTISISTGSQTAPAGSFEFSGITFNCSSGSHTLTYTGAQSLYYHECATTGTFRLSARSSGTQRLYNCNFAGDSTEFSKTLTAINCQFASLAVRATDGKLMAYNCIFTAIVTTAAGANDRGLLLVGCTVTLLTPSTMTWTNSRIDACDFTAGIPSAVAGLFTGTLPVSVGMNAIIKPTDENRTSTVVLANDADFAFDVEANCKYAVEGILLMSCASASPDARIGMTIPSGTIRVGVQNTQISGATEAAIITVSGAATGTLSIGTGGDSQVRVSGSVIVGGTGGTARLQWCQDSSNATPTILKAASVMSLRRIS